VAIFLRILSVRLLQRLPYDRLPFFGSEKKAGYQTFNESEIKICADCRKVLGCEFDLPRMCDVTPSAVKFNEMNKMHDLELK
jgi:hypothetical protein